MSSLLQGVLAVLATHTKDMTDLPEPFLSRARALFAERVKIVDEANAVLARKTANDKATDELETELQRTLDPEGKTGGVCVHLTAGKYHMTPKVGEQPAPAPAAAPAAKPLEPWVEQTLAEIRAAEQAERPDSPQ